MITASLNETYGERKSVTESRYTTLLVKFKPLYLRAMLLIKRWRFLAFLFVPYPKHQW